MCWASHITELKSQLPSLLDQLNGAKETLDHRIQDFRVCRHTSFGAVGSLAYWTPYILHLLECHSTDPVTTHAGRLLLSTAGPWVLIRDTLSGIHDERNCTEAGVSPTFLEFPLVDRHFTTVRYVYITVH